MGKAIQQETMGQLQPKCRTKVCVSGGMSFLELQIPKEILLCDPIEVLDEPNHSKETTGPRLPMGRSSLGWSDPGHYNQT
jgi:hypothetical protein